MQELKVAKPIESPDGTDPSGRLIERLVDEGFVTAQTEEDWQRYGERIYSRREKISIFEGETIFIFNAVADLNERLLRQASESVVQSYKAKSTSQKALSVLQSTTVYHVLVTRGDQPHNHPLRDYITRTGGATFVPVVMVPEINQVLYPNLEEKMGSIAPRITYLQYLLGERRDRVDMHRQTVHAFYASIGIILLLLAATIAAFH